MSSVHPHSARLLAKHLRLLWRVARNELKARYAGSIFGAGWALLTPLLLLGTNAVVYSYILQVRVPGLTTEQYILYIFSGLVPFMMTSESVGVGVGSVLASRSVWTNTVFPVDLAPPKAVLLSQGTMIVGYTMILVGLAALKKLSVTVLLLPIIWGFHVLALVGLVWVLSLLTLVFRDIQNAIGLLLMILMIGSPIAYTPEMVPEKLRFLVALNPFAYYVQAYQSAAVLGTWPSAGTMIAVVVISLGAFFAGGLFFARIKPVMLDYV